MNNCNTMSADEVLAAPRECTNCGGRSLSWDVSNRNCSGVVEGRLRTGDIDSICVLGCDDCSETLSVVPTLTAVAALIARNAELEAHTPSALREKLRSCEEALQAVESERDALAAEVKALRNSLQELVDFTGAHGGPYAKACSLLDAARASATTGCE